MVKTVNTKKQEYTLCVMRINPDNMIKTVGKITCLYYISMVQYTGFKAGKVQCYKKDQTKYFSTITCTAFSTSVFSGIQQCPIIPRGCFLVNLKYCLGVSVVNTQGLKLERYQLL